MKLPGLNHQTGFVNVQILTDLKGIAITSALLPHFSRLLVEPEVSYSLTNCQPPGIERRPCGGPFVIRSKSASTCWKSKPRK